MSSVFNKNSCCKVINLSEQPQITLISWYSIKYSKYETGFYALFFFSSFLIISLKIFVKIETSLFLLLKIFFIIISPLLLTEGFWKSLKSFKISSIFVISSFSILLYALIVFSKKFNNYNYGRIKQNFINDVI